MSAGFGSKFNDQPSGNQRDTEPMVISEVRHLLAKKAEAERIHDPVKRIERLAMVKVSACRWVRSTF